MADIAFFGLGAMGTPIATNLIEADNRLSVYDISEAACERLAQLGARVGTTPADTVRGCDFVITLLPSSIEVRETVLGPHGALSAAGPNTVFIDMTTGSLADFVQLHGDITRLGMTLIDSPIARGPAGSALTTKIINNYLASVSVVANAEALAMASAAGLNRDFLRSLFKRTVAGRGSLETVYPGKALTRDLTPGFSARLARKDLLLIGKHGQ